MDTLGRKIQAIQQFKQRAFSGSISAQNDQAFAGLHSKVYLIQGYMIALISK